MYKRNMIIAICGLAGAGKDTLASVLVEKHGFIKLSFGGILKDMASMVFSWDRDMLEGVTSESRVWREQVDPWWSQRLQIPHLTPRWVLQHMGTDLWRNHFHNDIWVACLERKLQQHPHVVVTDCRFPNEVQMLKDHGATLVHIHRGVYPSWFMPYKTGELVTPPSHVHASEYAWIRTSFDVDVANDRDGMEHLEKVAKALSI